MHILLVGTGYMAYEYSRVLDELNVDYTIVGRGEESATQFYRKTEKKVLTGGLENVFHRLDVVPTHAIIASTLESLEENTLFLLNKAVKFILVEKPASVSSMGMQQISELANKKKSQVYIAYNRRFYSSVLAAEKRINEDGGLSSFLFEFTEWSHLVDGLNKTDFQLNNWFIGNSTHVLDTAFYFGGKPKEVAAQATSSLSWHPKGSVYVGSGITERDILFSYHANWQAPGSWKLELLTTKNRFIFRPFEKLHVQKAGSVVVEQVFIENEIDKIFKPGLFKQTKTFLFGDEMKDRLLTVHDGLENMKFYEQINGFSK
ncbi:Gfo/Idh/MocA family oxidoreductase [Domibacillus enclensis]|uniref:Predicted dehydrogenase n=1 Tax=Domibacillus enclensis TaxID=1017273 RepID=A0A1N6SBR3_9BACI|nr:Gfo/Idh/MocA family oxidoreductase [Domibacillus enclensis]OXS79279.1 hypothetical protein B1B05_05775 [Domibacillus enclensis]SIQ38603.1 Predicted dehydrogenase [Domibacillus enclensis]